MGKMSREQIRHAEKMGKEIENQASHGNIHVAQERGQMQLTDNFNEEA
jgi:PAB1-binding protein PBP1